MTTKANKNREKEPENSQHTKVHLRTATSIATPTKDYSQWTVSKARTQYFSLPSNARAALSVTTFSATSTPLQGPPTSRERKRGLAIIIKQHH